MTIFRPPYLALMGNVSLESPSKVELTWGPAGQETGHLLVR